MTGWPVLRQVRERDLTALGASAFSKRTIELTPRTKRVDRVVKSICPYCAVGCGQNVYVKDGRITDIEGDPDSPISEGCLCPKGAATFQLVTGSHRVHSVLYRRPYGTRWEPLPLQRAMDMVAERVKKARDEHWEDLLQPGTRRARGHRLLLALRGRGEDRAVRHDLPHPVGRIDDPVAAVFSRTTK